MSIDKVLAALDAGLQTSYESGTTTDYSPEMCARCQLHEPATDGELCPSCRSFLLGDSDVDPSRGERQDSFTQALIDSLSRPVEAGARAATRAAMTFVNVPGAPIRVQRLDREGWPTGEPESLEGYVVHHVDGDPRNNSIDNLRLMPAQDHWERAEGEPGDYTAWRQRGDMILWEYRVNGQSGSYLTNDLRPFTVRPFVAGSRRGGELLDADGHVAHFVWHQEFAQSPAAFRVEDEFTNPAHRWLIACTRCAALYAVDQHRREEGLAIMRNDGHGEGGLCMLGVALQDSEDEDDRIDASVDLPAPWQVELFEQMRRVVAGARERLGL